MRSICHFPGKQAWRKEGDQKRRRIARSEGKKTGGAKAPYIHTSSSPLPAPLPPEGRKLKNRGKKGKRKKLNPTPRSALLSSEPCG